MPDFRLSTMNRELDFIKDMFDGIAGRYDFLNRLLSMGQDVVWRSRMVQAAGLERGNRVLDAACGTGDVSAEIIKQKKGSVKIIGIDFSMSMLKLAKKKLKQKSASVELMQGNALYLPFSPSVFDSVFIAFGIRNIVNKDEALKQFHKILKTNGKLVVLELTRPSNRILHKLYFVYFQKILPEIGSFFSKDPNAYSYLPESVLKFPMPEEFMQTMKNAGFAHLRFRTMTFGIVTLFVGEK